jgi:hypothetical protein
MREVTEAMLYKKCQYESKAEAILKEFRYKRSRDYRLSLLAKALEISYSEGRDDGIWTAEVASDVKIEFVKPSVEDMQFIDAVKAGEEPFIRPIRGGHILTGYTKEDLSPKTPSPPQTHDLAIEEAASPGGRQCPSATSENSGG